MKTSEILLRAVEVLKERGWNKYSLVDCDGRVCAVGAIKVATGMHPESIEWSSDRGAEAAFTIRVVGSRTCDSGGLPLGEGSLPTWNDIYAKSVDDVIELFVKTAELRASIND